MGAVSWVGAKALDAVLGLRGKATAYEVRRDLAVPVDDGVALLGDLYRPRDATGPLPVVLIRLPYGRAGLVGAIPAVLARRGFQVFIQSTRGTFGSGGHFRPFLTEHEDGLATVAWLREQPWCDGRVSMTGASYFGHTQWAVAPYVDPPLESVSPHVVASRISDTFYVQGAPALHTALTWSTTIGRQELGGLVPPQLPNPRVKARLKQALETLPLQAADTAVTGAPVPFWRDWVGHAEAGDDFWSTANHDGADLGRMPPVNMVTGWWDLFLPGQLADYAALRAAGVEARLVVGPWLHGAPGELRALLRGDVEWLDHHLRGGPAPKGAPVRLHLQQARTWLEFESWPPPARTVEHHLGANGSLGPAAEGVVGRFTYDPADPTPTVGGPLLEPPGRQADNGPVEQREDVLLFTGPPLPADLDVVGPVRARVSVRTSLEHADVFVRLCDVDPDGVSRNVVDGIRRLTAHADGEVEVELFPTAYRFKAGHRLRVQVAGGAFPRFARNPGTGAPLGTATDGLPCDFEIFAPSRVELPVISKSSRARSARGAGRSGRCRPSR